MSNIFSSLYFVFDSIIHPNEWLGSCLHFVFDPITRIAHIRFVSPPPGFHWSVQALNDSYIYVDKSYVYIPEPALASTGLKPPSRTWFDSFYFIQPTPRSQWAILAMYDPYIYIDKGRELGYLSDYVYSPYVPEPTLARTAFVALNPVAAVGYYFHIYKSELDAFMFILTWPEASKNEAALEFIVDRIMPWWYPYLQVYFACLGIHIVWSVTTNCFWYYKDYNEFISNLTVTKQIATKQIDSTGSIDPLTTGSIDHLTTVENVQGKPDIDDDVLIHNLIDLVSQETWYYLHSIPLPVWFMSLYFFIILCIYYYRIENKK